MNLIERELVAYGYNVLEVGIGGKWAVAAKDKSKFVFIRQSKNIWHCFYQMPGTGSGSNPKAAEFGCLGDVIGTDRELKRYCTLVEAVPEKYDIPFHGLYEGRKQAYNTLSRSNML